MVLTWPKNLPGLGTGAQRIKKSIETLSDGRLIIKIYGAGEFVPALQVFDAVQNGIADLYHGAAYYWQSKNPAFPFFSAVPFGMTYPEFEAWIRFGGGQALYDDLYARFSLKPFIAGSSGVQMGGFFRKKIESVQNLKGLKMRMPGLGGSVLQKLGVSTINLPGGETFQALQSGTIDATEWVGPWQDLNMGFYKIAKYYYYPGFHEPGTTWECVFNKNVWNSFSQLDRNIIMTALTSESALSFCEFTTNNALALKTLVDKHHVKLEKFNIKIYRAFAQATKDVLQNIANSNNDAAKVYDNYRAFYKKVAKWTDVSELAYLDLRKNVWNF